MAKLQTLPHFEYDCGYCYSRFCYLPLTYYNCTPYTGAKPQAFSNRPICYSQVAICPIIRSSHDTGERILHQSAFQACQVDLEDHVNYEVRL